MDDERGALDQAALEALYVRLEKPMYNVVYRRLWDPVESRDVVQEAFLRLWRMRGRVMPSTVEPLVYRIALNLAAKRRRSARVWKWLSLDAVRERAAPRGDAEGEMVNRERTERLRDAVEQLPEGYREVVLLCEFANMTYERVGEILSLPPGTVGSRRHKAMRLLRERLGEWTGPTAGTAPEAMR